jgi:hypothetical protein
MNCSIKILFAALLLCCLAIGSCAVVARRETPPDPMGTGSESLRYVFWVLSLPVGPPMHLEPESEADRPEVWIEPKGGHRR